MFQQDGAPAHRALCTELEAGHRSRFIYIGPLASEFADYKPNGLSRVFGNVGGLPQA